MSAVLPTTSPTPWTLFQASPDRWTIVAADGSHVATAVAGSEADLAVANLQLIIDCVNARAAS